MRILLFQKTKAALVILIIPIFIMSFLFYSVYAAAPVLGTTGFNFMNDVSLASGNGTNSVFAANIGSSGWDFGATMTAASTTANLLRGGNNEGTGATAAVLVYSLTDSFQSVTFASNDGSEFDLKSIDIQSTQGTTNITITGFRDGNAVAGATINGFLNQNAIYSNIFDTINIDYNNCFNNIDKFTIMFQTPQKRFIFDNIVIGPAIPDTFNVTYDGNGNTSGVVPTDAKNYNGGEAVTVAGNTGSLLKADYYFAGWNTLANGSGTTYSPGAGTFNITGNITLYAKWDVMPIVTVIGPGTASGDGWVNSAEKAAGFNVVARSNVAGSVLYVVPSETPNNLEAITGASIASANSAGANINTTIAITGGNAGVVNGTAYKVYAIDETGNISPISEVAFAADLSEPVISSGALVSSNTYFDINFNEGVFGASDGMTELTVGKLAITFTKNNGGVNNAFISSVKRNDNSLEGSASQLTGGETTVRVFLSIFGTPTGVETIEIKPAISEAIFDKAGNPMSVTETSGIKTLYDQTSPEINVKGNNKSISNGNQIPSITDYTDFGSVNAVTGAITRAFTIENIGTKLLKLTGNPLVTITGSNSSDFSVITHPATSDIEINGSVTFEVSFHPSNAGLKTATINIGNTDTDENPYIFSIQGTAIVAVPEAPTIGAVTAGDGQASVSFTAPASDGGALISGYTVTSDPDGLTGVGTSSPITVTGLKNGTSYRFTITATNSAGTSSASAASDPVTPAAEQTITFDNPGAQYYGTAPTLTASASSGLPVTFVSLTPDVCSVSSDGTMTFLTTGTAMIQAEQQGNGSYLPALPVSWSFSVNAVTPGAPLISSTTAGIGEVAVNFSVPEFTGGSPITGYTVYTYQNGLLQNLNTTQGSKSPIRVTGLTPGVGYTFSVAASNEIGRGAESNPSPAISPSFPPSDNSEIVAPILINGKLEAVASQSTTFDNGKTVFTVSLDEQRINEKLQREAVGATVTIPVNNQADVVVGELNGQIVKNMETKEVVLEIKTENVTYTLPASQINIDQVSESIGKQVELKDIKVNVVIAEPNDETVKIIDSTANKNGYQTIVKPVEFSITCSSTGKFVEVSKFSGYVERMVAIPEGIDPSRITTGIVLNQDGTFSHVPTTIIVIDGKYYAKINSLTNSVYTVIWNPVTVDSVENHWSKASVNDMASRLIIDNPEAFNPEGAITRGEYAAYITKALGIYRTAASRAIPFTDVSSADRFANAISIASEYGIVRGYPDGSFKPDALITRQEAMVMYSRAMDIIKLVGTNPERIIMYTDRNTVAEWAYKDVQKVLSANVFNGTTSTTISPNASFKYAEAATAIRNLLVQKKFIN